MKLEPAVFAGLALLLGPWAVVYWLASYEPAGSALLVVLVVAFAFVGVYLLVRSRQPGAEPEPGVDEDLGYYPSSSIWPFTIAAAVTVVGYGLAFSGWVALPGVVLLLVAVVGYAVEAQTRPD